MEQRELINTILNPSDSPFLKGRKSGILLIALCSLLFALCSPVHADFIVSNGATVTVTNGGTLDSSGSVHIESVLDASGSPSGIIRLTKDWKMLSTGAFVQGNSSVTFYNIMTSSVTGNTTFYVLFSTDNQKTIRFQSGSTQTVSNSLNFGANSLTNEVKLRSTINGEKWYFRVLTSTRRISFVDVQDSYISSNGVTACNSVDSGANVVWAFPGDLAVQVSAAQFDLGSVAIGSYTYTTSGIVVTNIGCGAVTYQLKAATATAGTPWSVGADTDTAPSGNKFLLRGLFHNVQPSTTSFAAEDVVHSTNASSTASKFSAGVQTGVSVPFDEQRTIWWFLEMPLTTGTTWQQRINATVTATTP